MRLKNLDWECPMRMHSKASVDLLSGQLDGVVFNVPRFSVAPFQSPPLAAQPFLCCSQCPLVCCRFDCPWNSNALGPSCIPYCLQPCVCKLESCVQCTLELQFARYSFEGRLMASGRGDDYYCLCDPPPQGFKLYDGVGEPISDSSRKLRKPIVYVLTCRRWTRQETVAIGSQRKGNEAFVMDIFA